MKTINIQNETISSNLLALLNQKVQTIKKNSFLTQLKKEEIKDLMNLEIILGVYRVFNDNEAETFLVYKIFVPSDALVKGAYKDFNLIANGLLKKNQNKEKTASKINIYHNINNNKFYDTIIEFVKSKIAVEELSPGEYILQGLKLGDLLETAI